MVESAVREGAAGSLAVRHRSRPRSTVCNGSRSRATASASRCCSVSTSSTGSARSSRCRSRWRRPGIPRSIEHGQAVAAREARAVGIHWTFAPMVDIARDPRWGRIIEGAGEDPVPRRCRRRRPGARIPGRRAGRARSRDRRPEALRRLRRRARSGATTTRSTSPTPSCGTCTSRRSRRRSRPAPAT